VAIAAGNGSIGGANLAEESVSDNRNESQYLAEKYQAVKMASAKIINAESKMAIKPARKTACVAYAKSWRAAAAGEMAMALALAAIGGVVCWRRGSSG